MKLKLIILCDFTGAILDIFEPIIRKAKGHCPRIEDLIPEFKKKVGMSKSEILDIAINLAIADEYTAFSVPWTMPETIDALKLVSSISKKKRKLAPDLSENQVTIMSLGVTKTANIPKSYEQWMRFEVNRDPYGLE